MGKEEIFFKVNRSYYLTHTVHSSRKKKYNCIVGYPC